MNKTKKMIEESILFAIESIKEDITNTSDIEENNPRAEAIKTLAEAYDIVHRGKKGDSRCLTTSPLWAD